MCRSAGKPILMIFKEYERARQESPLEEIVALVSSKKIPDVLDQYGYKSPAVLGMELDVLPTNLYFQYCSIFKKAKIEDISFEIRLIRAVKSDFEIEKMQGCGKIIGYCCRPGAGVAGARQNRGHLGR